MTIRKTTAEFGLIKILLTLYLDCIILDFRMNGTSKIR